MHKKQLQLRLLTLDITSRGKFWGAGNIDALLTHVASVRMHKREQAPRTPNCQRAAGVSPAETEALETSELPLPPAASGAPGVACHFVGSSSVRSAGRMPAARWVVAAAFGVADATGPTLHWFIRNYGHFLWLGEALYEATTKLVKRSVKEE